MAVPTSQELKLKVYSNIHRAFEWVMVTSSSSSLTIGENNRNKNVCRAAAWIILVCLPALLIASSAGSAYIMYSKPIRGDGFPWFLVVVMLWGIYMAVVQLATWHLTLFLPKAPFAAVETLRHVGLEKIGFAVTLTSVPVLIFDLTCILWSCLVGLLIAATLAFWIWLVRMYGDWATSKGGLATSLAFSSLLTAAILAFLIWLVRTTGSS